MCTAKIIVGVIGLCMSIFYGFKAVNIFVADSPFVEAKKKFPSWWIHQWWLNFFCSAIGWFAAYYFVFYRLIPLRGYSFKGDDAALIVVAMLGLAGFLPQTLSLIPLTLGSIVSLLPKKKEQ